MSVTCASDSLTLPSANHVDARLQGSGPIASGLGRDTRGPVVGAERRNGKRSYPLSRIVSVFVVGIIIAVSPLRPACGKAQGYTGGCILIWVRCLCR
eukprot:2301929-Rhodomonas_salina.2